MEVSPETRVIAVTAMDDQRLGEEIVRAGFRGYLLKDTKISQLLSAIQVVLSGDVVFPAGISRSGTGQDGRPSQAGCSDSSSPRELEVLEMLSRGAGGREIARSPWRGPERYEPTSRASFRSCGCTPARGGRLRRSTRPGTAHPAHDDLA
jgi:hypothetical protein